MKSRTNLFQSVVMLVLLAITAQCFGYGREGPKAVGLMAQNHLNEKASKAAAKLLQVDKCKDLACVVPWPDDLKQAARNQGPLKDYAESKTFQAFPNNSKWHFVNLPLGSDHYVDNGPFSTNLDIVHSIKVARHSAWQSISDNEGTSCLLST